MTKAEYDEIIRSIVDCFLQDVAYTPRPTDEDNDDFDFYDWWDEVQGYDTLAAIVDSYAAGSWTMHLGIMLEATTDVNDLDDGLWLESSTWKSTVMCIAYELLRCDATQYIEGHVTHNRPPLEPGSVEPRTSDIQIWLGAAAPVFLIEKTQQDNEVSVVPGCIALSYKGLRIVLEGETFNAEPRDLKELTTGGTLAIRPRRVYMPANETAQPTVQNRLVLFIQMGWVSIPDYEQHKAVLPQLSLDGLTDHRLCPSKS